MSMQSIEARLDSVKKQQSAIKAKLAELPEGGICVYKCDGYTRYKGSYRGKSRYFRKEELPLVKKLLLRKYLQLKLNDLKTLERSLAVYRRIGQRQTTTAAQYLIDHPEAGKLLADQLVDRPSPYLSWMQRPDPLAAPHQDKRTEHAVAGMRVRSKSEVMIAAALYECGLPFRYEEPLLLGGKMYFPDFTIREPHNGSFYWYEHFGMMDDMAYANQAFDKMKNYARHGIVPGINLITTFETKEKKLQWTQIHHAIELFF